VTVDSDGVAEAAQSLADLRAVVAEKPDITKLILAVLSPFPYGLTTCEIRGLTGMASYNASAKLSKLAAYGVIEKFNIAGDHRHRWRVKPGTARLCRKT
jgi:DNA-binding transcriptional regulator GbsR (MarR family)